MNIDKILNVYKYISRYLSIVLLIVNIFITIISSVFDPYIYTVCGCNSLLLLISRFFLSYALNGIFRKRGKRILKAKEYLYGGKARFNGILWLLIYLFTLFIIVFIELWLIYWVFQRL